MDSSTSRTTEKRLSRKCKQNGINIQRRRKNEIAERTKPTDPNEEAETAGGKTEIVKTSEKQTSYRKNESG